MTRMVGAFADKSAESDSSVDWDEGGLSVTVRENMQRFYRTYKRCSTCTPVSPATNLILGLELTCR